jgi:hypothetical protein
VTTEEYLREDGFGEDQAEEGDSDRGVRVPRRRGLMIRPELAGAADVVGMVQVGRVGVVGQVDAPGLAAGLGLGGRVRLMPVVMRALGHDRGEGIGQGYPPASRHDVLFRFADARLSKDGQTNSPLEPPSSFSTAKIGPRGFQR